MKKQNIILIIAFFACCFGLSAQSIVDYEYWFNQNFSARQQLSANGQKFTLSSANAVSLDDGIHTLHFRAKDANNQWSVVYSQAFYKNTAQGQQSEIVYYEYWFNTNFAGRQQTTLSQPDGSLAVTTVNAASLAEGVHTLHFRARDQRGRWTPVYSQAFYRIPARLATGENNMISGYRYWFNDDIGNAITETLAEPVNPLELERNISIPDDLQFGSHAIHFQFFDLAGGRSVVETEYFNYLEYIPPIDAQKPEIFVQPQDTIYTHNANADALMVWAEVSDGGTLSYQWYSNVDNNNYSGSPVGTDASLFTPSTAQVGTMYYYVIVTNTIDDNGDNGVKVARDTSELAMITVNAVSLPPVDAQKPEIFVQPQDTIYKHNANAVALMVWADVDDDGELSYQWYSNVENNNYSGTPVDANSESYTPNTATSGVMYYYVIVTNTINDNGDGGIKEARDTSAVATIIVIPELSLGDGVVEGIINNVLPYLPTSGITVFLYILDEFLKSSVPENHVLVGVTETDADGRYHFPNLPEGSYIVVVDIDGYNTATSEPVELIDGATNGSVNFSINSDTGTVTAGTPNVSGGNGGGELTSIAELFMPNLKIYPNPFTGEVRITGAMVETRHATSLRTQMQIINATGALVHTQTITNEDETINLEHLPAGVYVFRFEKDGKTHAERVVKN